MPERRPRRVLLTDGCFSAVASDIECLDDGQPAKGPKPMLPSSADGLAGDGLPPTPGSSPVGSALRHGPSPRPDLDRLIVPHLEL
jgi:hypothetical protein